MKTIVDSNGLLQLNEKYIEELDHKTLPLTTAKYFSGQKKQTWTIRQIKNSIHIIFICKELATKIIMDCRTTVAPKFRTGLGFKL